MWHIILALVAVALTVFYLYVRNKMSYWRKLGVPEDPGYFPFGSQASWDFLLQRIAFTEITDSVYWNHPDAKVVGGYDFFGRPNIAIRDLDIAKQILVKDFDQFSERKPDDMDAFSPHSKNNKYFRNMLIELRGQEWKQTRSSLTPIFTSGKLKAMVPLIHKAASECCEYLESQCGEDIEGKDLMVRFALDTIISTGFGYEINSFQDKENDFKKNADLIVGKNFSFKDIIGFFLYIFAPKLLQYFDMPLLNKDAERFFVKVILQSMEERRSSPIKRNDLIDLILEVFKKEEMKKESKGDEDDNNPQEGLWSLEELEEVLISNSLMLFLVGFDTVSTTSAICLYCLAKHQSCQQKLYEEICEAVEKSGGEELGYAEIMNLEYMEMVFQETLRYYPLTHVERASKNDYKIPGTDITIPKGIFVRVPTTAIAKDEKYYDNPHSFNPENFSAEMKANRHPYAVNGFGQGPRNCIGMRYATLEVKLAIARIVHKFKILPCEKTVDELIPDPKYIVSASPKGGLYFTVEKR